jgi:hypothetical protein
MSTTRHSIENDQEAAMKDQRPGRWIGSCLLATLLAGGCGTTPLQTPTPRPSLGPLWNPPTEVDPRKPVAERPQDQDRTDGPDRSPTAGNGDPAGPARSHAAETQGLLRETGRTEIDRPAPTRGAAPGADPIPDTCQGPPPLEDDLLTELRERIDAVSTVSNPRAGGPARSGIVERDAEPPGAARAMTAAPFAHSTDYRYLSGQVYYSHVGKSWVLRYAPVEQKDPHGGSVKLAKSKLLDTLEDGQWIRVQGELDPSPGKSSPPLYQVKTVEVVDYPRPSLTANRAAVP